MQKFVTLQGVSRPTAAGTFLIVGTASTLSVTSLFFVEKLATPPRAVALRLSILFKHNSDYA